MTTTPQALPDPSDLIDRLRRHYGRHFTTTKNGIVTGEHFDFTRHPLVGEAIAAIAAQRPAGTWRPIETAPKDGTLLWLLVAFEDHATEDTDEPCPTIGANSLTDTGDDEWKFAGWCWTQDHFTEGVGRPVAWMPIAAATQAAVAEPETVPWPVVTSYSGGASHEGIGGRVHIRLADVGPEVEYVPAAAPAAEMEAQLRRLVGITHCPNPGDPTRRYVSPGNGVAFSDIVKEAVRLLGEKP